VPAYLIGAARDAKHVAATGKFKATLRLAVDRLGQRKGISQPVRLPPIQTLRILDQVNSFFVLLALPASGPRRNAKSRPTAENELRSTGPKAVRGKRTSAKDAATTKPLKLIPCRFAA